MQACHQGRVPHCASFPIWHVGSEYLSEALPHDVHLSLVLIIEHSPRFKSKASRTRVPSHFVISKAQNCLFYPPANCFASRPSSLMEAVCSEATSRCAPMPATRFQLYSVCVSTVEVRDTNGVPSVQNAISFSCHAARTRTRFPPTTGSRVLVVLHEQQRKMSQAACPKKSLNTVAAPPP